jgi:hypothetical protein
MRIWRKWKIGVICGTQNHLRIHGKYLNAFGEYTERIYAYMEKTQRNSWRIRRIKGVFLSVNNHTNVKFFYILSTYIIWDRLSQKTISRYCPFQGAQF